jgi:hypothetical protein
LRFTIYELAVHCLRFTVHRISPFSLSRLYSAQLVPPEGLISGEVCANERIEIALQASEDFVHRDETQVFSVVKLGDLIVDIKSEPLIGLTCDCERIRKSADTDRQVTSTAKPLATFGFAHLRAVHAPCSKS